MAYYSQLTIAGTEVEFQNGMVSNTIGDDNTASNFSFSLDNKNGFYSGDFTVGNEVIVKVHTLPITGGEIVNAITIFDGILEDINISGPPNNSQMTISGRDYTARLQDITIPPEVYTNQVVEDIIEDIFNKYVENVTYNKTVIGVTIQRIVFKHTSVFDALKRLAEIVNGIFWVDTSKATHFVFKGTTNSGKTFNNTNTFKASWSETRRDMFNQVWVYGDRYLDGFEENFTANGTGSVFGLSYKPHSSFVTTDGSISRGGIANFNIIPSSGINHVINFHDKNLIFISGIEVGNNIPASGVAINIKYDRDLPIVKFGRNRTSINSIGLKEKVIVDKNIKDPDEAVDLMKSTLVDGISQRLQGDISIEGILTLTAGQTCVVNFPNDNINSVTYNMIEILYDLNKEALLRENIINVKLNKRIKSIQDTIKEIIIDLKKIQAGDADETDIFTRTEFDDAQIQMQEDSWYVKQRFTGSDTLWGLSTWSGGTWDGSYDFARTITASGGNF